MNKVLKNKTCILSFFLYGFGTQAKKYNIGLERTVDSRLESKTTRIENLNFSTSRDTNDKGEHHGLWQLSAFWKQNK